MKKNRREILKFLLTALAVVAIVFIIYIWQEQLRNNNSKPTIICPTTSISVSVESLSDNSILLRDVTAMDVEDGDITSSLVVESVSPFVEQNHCIITYSAFDSDNNVSKFTRHLFLTDYTQPRFTITAPLEFGRSSSFNPLACVGAYDCVDGDISDRVKMNPADPEDDLTTIGLHPVEFRVTNSLGDLAVLKTDLEVYERTYTETRMIPNIQLKNYLLYVDCYGRIDPAAQIDTISVGGSIYTVSEYKAGTIEIDDSEVKYDTPGMYRIYYTCNNRQEYYGTAVLLILVTEVSR